MTPRETIGYGLDALVIFRNLQSDPVIRSLMQFCHTDRTNLPAQIRFYSAMTAALYEKTDNLTDYIKTLVLEYEQVCIIRAGAGEEIPDAMKQCLNTELEFLERIAMLTPAQLQAEMVSIVPLPVWNVYKIDLKTAYAERIADIAKCGYGNFAKFHMFTVSRSGEIIPVEHPDPIKMDDMIGYERERHEAEENVIALLNGNYAMNVLLSGDAGTGKSATVKAIANTYADQGLRLIELNKDQLCFIPQIMDKLSKNPLKFILFIDDLTFSEDDPNFGTLKATLEGSIAARMKNTVIYATSNRRHIVKETFGDGSDKHENDTVQERISLSERFGITITYSKPQKKLYLEIVNSLAKQAGLIMDEDKLAMEAEQFALCKSGRSARAARQLVDKLLILQNTKKESI
ncbi:MAG: ATP-binding protein [Ruminococcus sp.]|nr:ATP-binding protein [Ruminococcus sp.]